MFTPVVAAAGVTVNVIGTPALAADGSAVKRVRPRALTLTVASPFCAPAVAVTFAGPAVVVSVTVALPLASLVATDGEMLPLSVAKLTGTPDSGLPPSSVTFAVTCTLPPDAPRDCGVVVTMTRPAAAVPTLRLVI